MAKSSITNCRIYTRPDAPTIIVFPNDDGRAFITMDRYLIAPLEMFSERQLKMALKKWHKPLPGK